jgi:hypothetical protein
LSLDLVLRDVGVPVEVWGQVPTEPALLMATLDRPEPTAGNPVYNSGVLGPLYVDRIVPTFAGYGWVVMYGLHFNHTASVAITPPTVEFWPGRTEDPKLTNY